MNYTQLTSSQSISKSQGDAGETFALAFERKRLPDYLHSKILCFGEDEVALGYDIISFESKDDLMPERYIEVKTFRGHPHFYWTVNEIEAAKKYSNHYYLYLVDIERIDEVDYEPTIIPNPATLFNENSQWSFQVQQYVFTLNSNEQVPDDWDDSIILFGCYNNEAHLQWILHNKLYNVRSGKNAPGAVTLNPSNTSARYLVLYSSARSCVYSIYKLSGPPQHVTRKDMLDKKYPNPHGSEYYLHPIERHIDSFYIDMRTLLNDANHSTERSFGTPLYVAGIQLRKFMASNSKPSPTVLEKKSEDSSSINTIISNDTTIIKESKPGNPNYMQVQKSLHKNAYAPWTPELDQQLLQLYKSNTSIEKIMDIMQRNRGSILSRLKKLCKK